MAGLLGDIKLIEVAFQPAGGGTTLGKFRNIVDTGKLTLVLDGTGQMKASIPQRGFFDGANSQLCLADILALNTWGVEGSVRVDGFEYLVGPVTDVLQGSQLIDVEVSDASALWERREIETMIDASGDLATLFAVFHEEVIGLDNRFGTVLHLVESLVQGERFVSSEDNMFLATMLRELARSGVDYTMVGRNLYVNGVIDRAPVATLTDAHFVGEIKVQKVGKAQANYVVVVGGSTATGGTVRGIAQDPTSIAEMGKLVRVFRESSILDVPSAVTAAEQRLETLLDPIVITMPTGSLISPMAPVTLSQLIPGNVIRINTSATGVSLERDFRIGSLTIHFNGTVSATFIPIGGL